MDIKSLVLIISSLAVVTLALIVLLRAPKKSSSWTFLFHSFFLFFWTIGIVVFLQASNPQIAELSVRLYYIAALGIASSILLFALIFAKKRIKIVHRIIILVNILFGLAILLLPALIMGTISIDPEGNTLIINNFVYTLYGLLIMVDFGIAILSFYAAKNKFRGREKQQASLLFWGYILASLVGTTFNLFLPWVGNYGLIWIGPLSTLIFVGVVGYTIIHHKLFDIRAAIVRSFLYILSFIAFSLVYVVLITLISNTITEGSSKIVQQMVNVIVALVIVYTAIPFKKEYDRVTNSIFFKDKYDPQEVINDVNATLVSSTVLPKVLVGVLGQLSYGMNVKSCSFYLSPKELPGYYIHEKTTSIINENEAVKVVDRFKRFKNKSFSVEFDDQVDYVLVDIMRTVGIDVVVKMASGNEQVGYLLVGVKKSGSAHSDKDVRFLEAIADGVSIAIQNSLRFEEISEFNATLQQKIEDATRQLKRSNEKLKALDEAKDDFVSMASHQLRTPLTSVKGYLSMVLEGDAGDLNNQQRSMLDQAFTSSQRMTYLIADLLNLSRLKTGKFVIDNKPTNLAKVITQELSQVQATAESRKLQIAYEEPSVFPTLMLDDTKIRQVIMNFVDNAIYYTPAGGSITVKLEELDKSIEFTVHDTGIGVPAADQHNLFSKFYRAANAKQARPDGTGLGLFMARKVIVAQGGATIFKSKAGKGSTFGFSFPKTLVTTEKPKQT